MTPIYLQRTFAFIRDAGCLFMIPYEKPNCVRWSYVVMSFDGTEFSLS